MSDPATVFEDPYDLKLEQINMSDGRLYEQGLAAKYFTRLRAEAPVHFCPESDVGPFWSITKFKDIMEVDRKHTIFSADASHGGHLLGFETWFRDDPDMRMEMIIAMDPPRHDVQRKAVSPVVAADKP